ncbi:unnamed protein product [Cuscuta campestris]|uniref:Uncharacterized protein n=1 Tax=Cuscuta campestris TaxID=132261 RepID=A0A484L2H6_9ASTE|nr:unnamed protein product [Cuscuta campestris]
MMYDDKLGNDSNVAEAFKTTSSNILVVKRRIKSLSKRHTDFILVRELPTLVPRGSSSRISESTKFRPLELRQNTTLVWQTTLANRIHSEISLRLSRTVYNEDLTAIFYRSTKDFKAYP